MAVKEGTAQGEDPVHGTNARPRLDNSAYTISLRACSPLKSRVSSEPTVAEITFRGTTATTVVRWPVVAPLVVPLRSVTAFPGTTVVVAVVSLLTFTTAALVVVTVLAPSALTTAHTASAGATGATAATTAAAASTSRTSQSTSTAVVEVSHHLVPLAGVLTFARLPQIVLRLQPNRRLLCLPLVERHFLRLVVRLDGTVRTGIVTGRRCTTVAHVRTVRTVRFGARIRIRRLVVLIRVIRVFLRVLLRAAPVVRTGTVALVHRLDSGFVRARLAVQFALAAPIEPLHTGTAAATSTTAVLSIRFPLAVTVEVARFARILVTTTTGSGRHRPVLVVRSRATRKLGARISANTTVFLIADVIFLGFLNASALAPCTNTTAAALIM
uniref:Uncharacterized protein n=1 Tax=Anopheles farauti TaxID=69004 RepID=A0A182QDJ2_9DIPT